MLQLGTVAVLKRHSSYCFPNEDFGRVNKRYNPDFSIYFQWFVAKIEYSGLHLLSIHPKSSFWLHAVALLYPICRAHDASVEIKTWSHGHVAVEITC